MIYMFLTDGFEEVEAFTPLDVLRRCGAEVKTVGVSSKAVTGSHDIKSEADIMIDEVSMENMEMVILPGGPGFGGLKTEKVFDIINYAADNDIYIAAICAAPSVIGEMGLLKGKKATAYPGYEKYLEGAEALPDKVVCDGKYITAKGAGAASEFAFALAEIICGREKAMEIKNAMQY